MDFAKLVERLVNAFGMSEEDAVATAAAAAAGFTIDALLFPGGIPPGTVTLLSGVGGYTMARVLKNNAWYRLKTLARLDKMVEHGHLSKEQASEYKNRLIARWLKADHDTNDNPP